MEIKIICYFFLVAIISYGMGCFNGAIISSQFKHKSDVREKGSGNAGLTNYYRNFGTRGIISVFIIDIIKIIVSVLAGGIIFGTLGMYEVGQTIAMAFAILGHSFPISYGFRGGKGVLSTCGAIFIIDYRVLLIMLFFFAIAVFITRYISLGSIIMALCMPVSYYFFNQNLFCTIILTIISAVIIIMHRANIKRLINKSESKFVIRKD